MENIYGHDIDKISIEMLDMLDPLVKRAPNTACDPYKTTDIPNIPQRSLKYLIKSSDQPWISQLTLAMLILASRNYDDSSIYGSVSLLNNKIKIIYNYSDPNYKPSGFINFCSKIDYLLERYLNGTIPSNDSKETRISFYNRLRSTAMVLHEWLNQIPFEFRAEYKRLLLPIPNGNLYQGLISKKEITDDQRRRRKMQVDTLMPYYPEMRSQSHMRWNFICRLAEAYYIFLNQTLKRKKLIFPIDFTYLDGNLKYYFTLWNVESFMREKSVVWNPTKKQSNLRLDFFPELTRVVNTTDNSVIPIEKALWFAEILKHGCPYPNYMDEDKEWLKAWGYTNSSFVTSAPNLIYWHDRAFMRNAQNFTQGLLIPIEQLHLSLSFGILALDLFTTTGVRMNEALQINLSKTCLVRIVTPASKKAVNQEPNIRYSLRLIPKGDKLDQLADNFIGEETKKLLFKVGKILHRHYDLKEGAPLPIVPFDPNHKRAHRFKSAPYIFQAYGKHLSNAAIGSCLRLLVHGIVKERTKDGKVLFIRAHLLRHGFATHAVQVEKIPIDIVGKWLHQNTLDVTAYYSEVTDSMVADAADQYLIKIANHINVLDSFERSPKQLKDAYNEACSRTGTLAQVTGGHCTSHGLCKSQFACVGCAAKVPDPSKKNQIIHHQEWARKEVVFYREQGLLPEVHRLEKLITDADLELQEIIKIEEYRKDEELIGKIEVQE